MLGFSLSLLKAVFLNLYVIYKCKKIHLFIFHISHFYIFLYLCCRLLMEYEEHLRNTLEKVNIKIRMCMILVFGEYIWYLVNIFGIW